MPRLRHRCLVDADRIDSSGEHETGQLLAAAERLDRLFAFIDQRAARVPEGFSDSFA